MVVLGFEFVFEGFKNFFVVLLNYFFFIMVLVYIFIFYNFLKSVVKIWFIFNFGKGNYFIKFVN